jgi:large conductance mechanosensitive channel
MIKEFKEFMMRGNVIDMAVGVVIGGAFTAVIKGVVDSIITPLITLIIVATTGSKDTKFTSLNVEIQGVVFQFGTLVSVILAFLITGFVLFLFVKAINKLRALHSGEEEEEAAVLTELDYLQEIRDLLAEKRNPEA